MISVDLINGRRTDQVFGTSKYSSEIFKRIKGIELHRIEYPRVGTARILDGALKRTIYPFIVKKNVKKNTIKHITNQDLAFLLNFIDLSPSVVTCYDLIPVAYYHNNSLYWKLNLKGLQKADHIITISEFSKKEIIRLTDYPGGQISVVYPGVDTDRYFPRHDRSILSRYGITSDDFVILYVGSEEPRKNLSLLLNAIAVLKKELPGIKMVKVGSSQMGGDRKSLLTLIEELQLQKNVIFTGIVPEEELPLYYNSADIFVFPSFYEGFGLPPLEAMACGCPTLMAKNTSLVEVACREETILFDPYDLNELVEKISLLHSDDLICKDIIEKGLKRTGYFSWEESAQKTMEIYSKM